jgi:hypothetical protein
MYREFKRRQAVRLGAYYGRRLAALEDALLAAREAVFELGQSEPRQGAVEHRTDSQAQEARGCDDAPQGQGAGPEAADAQDEVRGRVRIAGRSTYTHTHVLLASVASF